MSKVTNKERQRCWRHRTFLRGNKMSEADKLFKELGYKKTKEKLYDRYVRIEPSAVIIIDRHDKAFEKFSYRGYGDYITMQELKAINMKCKELGWGD